MCQIEGASIEQALEKGHVDDDQLQDESGQHRPEHQRIALESSAEERCTIAGVDGHHLEHLRERENGEGDGARNALRLIEQVTSGIFAFFVRLQELRARFRLGDTEEYDSLFRRPFVPSYGHGFFTGQRDDCRALQLIQSEPRDEGVKTDSGETPSVTD